MAELTPLMKQYQEIKARHQDAILFFRLGDFYEMFGQDAVVASQVLQIALTTRDKGKKDAVPMCGIPYFAADTYISKLIKAGHKVAICEQVEDPKEAKGVLKRQVVRVITPGTHVPEHPKENNYLVCFFPQGRVHGLAVADVSTGELLLLESGRPLGDELARFEPREVLYPRSLKEDLHYQELLQHYYQSPLEDFLFDYSEALRVLLEHYGVFSLEAFGCEGMEAAISAAGALLQALRTTQGQGLVLQRPRVLREGERMFLDAATKRNLELVSNLRDGSREATLLWALDETLTPMGGRFLRGMVLAPLRDVQAIRRYLQAVEELLQDYERLQALRSGLRKVQDLERLAQRLRTATASPRDMAALCSSLRPLRALKEALQGAQGELLRELASALGEFRELQELLSTALQEPPPMSTKEGGIIKEGFHPQVDELRALSANAKDYIARLEAQERQRTGIASLKIGYNRVFGYYIEVTRPNLAQVPQHYVRKQTLASSERFITQELKEWEDKVLGAEQRLKELEAQVFEELLGEAARYVQELFATAAALAQLDYLASLAVLARRHNYVMPRVEDSVRLYITGGRHPVLERLPLSERFVPNDLRMDESHRLMVITGPNMAGKSTYMRQCALILLMAQMGSFVPAEEAVVGIADRVFVRSGAADYLSLGQSTFMVEMVETANILSSATARSLIVLDEVGRGTSTFDGISIAWATAEYIVQRLKARTLFATHYHELTELALSSPGVKNLNVLVREWGDEVIFLRKVQEGPADKSYGIQVARLAGLPEEVLKRAKAVLGSLEAHMLDAKGMPSLLPEASRQPQQMDLFGALHMRLLRELRQLPEDLNPQEALQKLRELRRLALS
jgi:DNA mismatch repair protein MutS